VTGKEKKSDSLSPKPDSSKVGNDSFDPTAISQKIRQALESESSTAVLDEEKITAVKTALQQGNYQIDADSIAEKILQFDKP
jgi:negative regulator of flagellin synthesis FlgM